MGPLEETRAGEKMGAALPTVALLTAAYTLNFLDRQLLAVLAEPIKADLQLSDTQLALLTGLAFAIFYSAVGVPLSWIADRTSRRKVIAASCLVWSAFTAACGLAQGYLVMFLARMGVAIGEAGATPSSHAIISELVSPARRALALAIFSLGLPLGVTLGGVVGGTVGAQMGWRWAFFVAAMPGFLLAPVLLFFLPRALRKDAAPAPAIGEAVKAYVCEPIVRSLSAASAAAALAGYGMLNWMPSYLMRVRGFTLVDIAAYYSPLTGVALGLGTFLGGYLVSRRRFARSFHLALVPGVAVLAAAPLLVLGLLAESRGLSLGLLSLAALCLALYLAPTLALLQNMTPATTRATASAILLLILNLVGLGGGPLLVGAASDLAASSLPGQPLAWGLATLVPLIVAAGSGYFALAWRLKRMSAPSAAMAGPKRAGA